MKDEHTYFEKMAGNGGNMVIYKGTFLSNQSLPATTDLVLRSHLTNLLNAYCKSFHIYHRYSFDVNPTFSGLLSIRQ